MNANKTKIVIEIKNKNPITLNNLSLSLLNIHSQYSSFLKKDEKFDYSKESAILYVQKLETGSCIVELVPAFVPLLIDLDTILGYAKYLSSTFDFFSGHKDRPIYDYSKRDCKEIHEIVDLTANDNGSNMNFKVEGDLNFNFGVDHVQSNAIQNNLNKHIEGLEEEENELYKKVMFYWSKADFSSQKQTFDDRGVIEKINSSAKKIVFINDDAKKYMMSHDEKIGKPWQDLAYFVDVEVIRINGVIKAYKITHVYTEDTFDPILSDE